MTQPEFSTGLCFSCDPNQHFVSNLASEESTHGRSITKEIQEAMSGSGINKSKIIIIGAKRLNDTQRELLSDLSSIAKVVILETRGTATSFLPLNKKELSNTQSEFLINLSQTIGAVSLDIGNFIPELSSFTKEGAHRGVSSSKTVILCGVESHDPEELSRFSKPCCHTSKKYTKPPRYPPIYYHLHVKRIRGQKSLSYKDRSHYQRRF